MGTIEMKFGKRKKIRFLAFSVQIKSNKKPKSLRCTVVALRRGCVTLPSHCAAFKLPAIEGAAIDLATEDQVRWQEWLIKFRIH